MSLSFRQQPGACPVCGAAHTTCTAGGGSAIAVAQTPQRDAAGLVAEQVQAGLPEGSFTTATYRGEKKKR